MAQDRRKPSSLLESAWRWVGRERAPSLDTLRAYSAGGCLAESSHVLSVGSYKEACCADSVRLVLAAIRGMNAPPGPHGCLQPSEQQLQTVSTWRCVAFFAVVGPLVGTLLTFGGTTLEAFADVFRPVSGGSLFALRTALSVALMVPFMLVVFGLPAGYLIGLVPSLLAGLLYSKALAVGALVGLVSLDSDSLHLTPDAAPCFSLYDGITP